jgi:hypothetical protein
VRPIQNLRFAKRNVRVPTRPQQTGTIPYIDVFILFVSLGLASMSVTLFRVMRKPVEETKDSLKSDKNNGYFT